MSDSLRDQLLGLGFKPVPKPAREEARQGAGKPGKPKQGRPRQDKPNQAQANPRDSRRQGKPNAPGKSSEMDLAKAYAIRAQKEKQERIDAEREKQEAARQRREAKAKLAAMLDGKALNAAEAEIARHFPYGGKIKRVYVTAEQLARLNAGELGVVQLDGRYLLVEMQVLAAAEEIFPAAVALKVDPDAPAEDDPYADPKYQVPDDLVW